MSDNHGNTLPDATAKTSGMTSLDRAKRAAGIEAAGLVREGTIVGLGTGSTTAFAIEELGRRVRDEALRITGTATSFAAELLARRHGIPLCDLRDVEAIDLAIDGADQVDPHLNLIKGRGAAHTREKVVAALARRMVVLVDETKLVDRLGGMVPVPVEVLPMAAFPIMRRLEKLGARPEIRMGVRKDGPVVTDQGFWIVDAWFAAVDDPTSLDGLLNSIPGVLDHGLFISIATDVFVGKADGTVSALQRS